MTAAQPVRLISIPMSHFCEKARWALEHAGIPYQEEKHLQLFHFPPVYRAGKSDTVPVLVTPARVLNDSTRILQWVDSQASLERKLYPTEPGLRIEVEEFEDYLDEGFGVQGRLWMYTYMLKEQPMLLKYARMQGVPAHELKLMPYIFPIAKRGISRILGMKTTSRTDMRESVNCVLEEVASRLSDGRIFLFGGRFTAADLTFAALSAAVLIPEDYGVPLPKLTELPDEMAEQVRVWREHPAGKFAARIYREWRRGAPT